MKLGPGAQVGVINLATNVRKGDESNQTRLNIHDVHEYRNQLIVIASSPLREVHTALRGVITIPARLASPIVLRGETDINICRLVELWGGSPLALVQGNELLVFVNTMHIDVSVAGGEQGEFWRGLDIEKRDDHLKKSARVIDRYYELRSAGKIDKLLHRNDLRFNVNGQLVGVGSKTSLWAPDDFKVAPQARPGAMPDLSLPQPPPPASTPVRHHSSAGMPPAFSSN